MRLPAVEMLSIYSKKKGGRRMEGGNRHGQQRKERGETVRRPRRNGWPRGWMLLSASPGENRGHPCPGPSYHFTIEYILLPPPEEEEEY